MIKKFFTSKLFYLILLFVINISVLISACVITIKPLEEGKEYFPSTENKITSTLTSRYLIQGKDFTTYKSHNAKVLDNENIYSTYIVDSKVVLPGSEIKKGDLIGSHKGHDVYSTFDSLCLDIKANEEVYEVITYNYNQFRVEISLGNFDYLHAKFDSSENYIRHDGDYYAMNFEGYDYSSYQSLNIVKAIFSPKDCRALINSNSNCTLEIKKEEYKNQICVPAKLFDSQLIHKAFYIVLSDKIIPIYVEAFEIVDNYALIRSTDIKLEKGMYLYLYE